MELLHGGSALMANTQLASEFGTDEIQNIVVYVPDVKQIKTVGIEAAQKLTELSGVRQGEFQIFNLDSILEETNKVVGIMTTVIGQSIGILQSMRIQQAAGLNGNRYATFHQLGKEQAQKLHEDDRLYDVGDTIFIGSTPLGNSSLSLYLREYHDNALSMYPAIGKRKRGTITRGSD